MDLCFCALLLHCLSSCFLTHRRPPVPSVYICLTCECGCISLVLLASSFLVFLLLSVSLSLVISSSSCFHFSFSSPFFLRCICSGFLSFCIYICFLLFSLTPFPPPLISILLCRFSSDSPSWHISLLFIPLPLSLKSCFSVLVLFFHSPLSLSLSPP